MTDEDHRASKRLHIRWAIGFLSLAVCGCGEAPQFTADEECLTAVDALWTAVTAQQTPWLEQSARELERLHDAGQLSSAAWGVLEGSIETARRGEWEPAAESLYDLIKAQRKAAEN
ncbi:MAG TPA: hypothetical protein VGN42_00645 [Pirellulales bacterium]|jgi:hypothetical protein|nr:hypothetical protein [Pirellulales bacterium]